jgi:hypothetical protein
MAHTPTGTNATPSVISSRSGCSRQKKKKKQKEKIWREKKKKNG